VRRKIPFCADFYGAAQPSKLCTMLIGTAERRRVHGAARRGG